MSVKINFIAETATDQYTTQEPLEVKQGKPGRRLVDVTLHIPENRTFDNDFIVQIKEHVRNIGISVLLGGETISVKHEVIKD